jgi:hypothetical protein
MIEALVFGLLGPIAGLLTYMIVFGPGSKEVPLDTSILFLPFTYLAGLFPALLTAAFDIILNVRGAKGIPKYLLTGAFGYAAAYVVAFGALMPLLIYQPRWGHNRCYSRSDLFMDRRQNNHSGPRATARMIRRITL